MQITVTINRDEVISSLERTTGYIGAKQIESDANAYERIALNQGDLSLLHRLWQESRERLCLCLRRHIDAEGIEDDNYRMDLTLSESFDQTMTATIESGVMSYFVQSMAAKWLAITDKDRAAEYEAAALNTLDELARKCYCKRRPVRPRYKA